MMRSADILERHQIAARIVDEAGGELVGRTRLQKVTCLAWLAGHLDSFTFEYRNYGPFSERLAGAMEIAAGLGLVRESERPASWGGWYSVFTTTDRTPVGDDEDRRLFITEAAKIGPIELELLATAVFLNKIEGFGKEQAWAETARRKPDKAANGRIERSRLDYAGLLRLPQRTPLPSMG